jgi:4-aminobutyrate aminotransferase/(S)-3-amino-2-methylpropionate transaminase
VAPTQVSRPIGRGELAIWARRGGPREQVEQFTHTCFMITPYEGYLAVCEELARRTPGDFPKRSALFNSGAEAVENAVKIARSYTRRSAVVVFDHAYHGRTNLTMALTAENTPYKDGFGPFAPEVYRMPMAYPYRWPTGPEQWEALAQVISTMSSQVGAQNVAAVVIEPIQGEGGFIVPGDGFLAGLAAFCQANGIVFVADEIQTGFARTGAWFACEHEGVVPDLVTTAKGIAGGLPLAAVTGRAEIMDSVHVGGLGGWSCSLAAPTVRRCVALHAATGHSRSPSARGPNAARGGDRGSRRWQAAGAQHGGRDAVVTTRPPDLTQRQGSSNL